MFPNPEYTGLRVNPDVIRTTVDYQQRTGLANQYYIYGPQTRRRHSPQRRLSPRRRFSPRRHHTVLEPAYTPYGIPLNVQANQYVPQPYKEWPYYRPKRPWRYWTKRWDPMYGYLPTGKVYDDWNYENPYGDINDTCVMRITLEEAFLGDMLEVPKQMWRDWAKAQGFAAVAFPRDKNITDHVYVVFHGVCPIDQQSSYIPEKQFDVEWIYR